jgi:hypothetical protein
MYYVPRQITVRLTPQQAETLFWELSAYCNNPEHDFFQDEQDEIRWREILTQLDHALKRHQAGVENYLKHLRLVTGDDTTTKEAQ